MAGVRAAGRVGSSVAAVRERGFADSAPHTEPCIQRPAYDAPHTGRSRARLAAAVEDGDGRDPVPGRRPAPEGVPLSARSPSEFGPRPWPDAAGHRRRSDSFPGRLRSIGRVSSVDDGSEPPAVKGRPDPAAVEIWSEAAAEWASWAMARVRASWQEAAPDAAEAVLPAPIGHGSRPGRVVARTKNEDPADWVTTLDEEIEDVLRAGIGARFPDHGVDGEERGRRPGGPGAPVWLLDPLDGTTNFVAGLPFVGVSLAVVADGKVVVGAVADPARASLLLAVAGGRPSLNGREVTVSAADTIAGGVVLTELVGSTAWPGIGRFCALVSGAHGCVRLCGSTSLSVAAVATGVARAAVLADYGHLDTAAAALAAASAGAVLYGPPGETILPVVPVDGLEGLVVAAPGVAAEILALYQRARTDGEILG